MPNLNLLRTLLVHAKGSLLGEQSLAPKPKFHQLLMHRAVEKAIWNDITETPGEADFYNSMLSQIPTHHSIEGKPAKGS